MPALTSVVLKDRATTPVSHTFAPFDVKDGVGYVVESTGLKLGDSRLSVTRRKTASGRWKASVKLEVPVIGTETINGIDYPKIVDIDRASTEFDFGPTATTTRRNNLVGMHMSALGVDQPLITKVLVDLEGVWG